MSAHPAPSLALLGLEPLRALFELATTKFFHINNPETPRGDGHPVVVFPGLAMDHWATATLRSHLERQGYAVYDWERGVNTGPTGDLHAWLDPLVGSVRELERKHDQKVSLVGWSLGGIYAREISKLAAKSVRRVVTLGTPFAGAPTATNASWLFELLNGAKVEINANLLKKLRVAPPVASTSVYSRTDGVVSWQGCIQDGKGKFENIEVSEASHFGMVLNNKVLDLVAHALSLPAGKLVTAPA